MLTLLSYLVSLVSFVCFIIVLIKLFQQKGALHGILGILSCGLYPLIWGWINVTKLNIKNIMLIWTIAIVASVITNVIVAGAAARAAMKELPSMEEMAPKPISE